MQRSSQVCEITAKQQERDTLSDHVPHTDDQTQELKQLYAVGDALIEDIRARDAARVYIISGPSGVGKDSVIDQLRVIFKQAQYVVTATTRSIREGEENGVHYLFYTRDDFREGIGAGAFIEHEEVYGNHYGVPRKPIDDGLRDNRDVIIKVDVKGAATLREKIPGVISIFLAPESMQALYHRLKSRKTEDPEVLMKRFRTACDELARVAEFDYVVFNENDGLDQAVNDIVGIITMERKRVDRERISLS